MNFVYVHTAKKDLFFYIYCIYFNFLKDGLQPTEPFKITKKAKQNNYNIDLWLFSVQYLCYMFLDISFSMH